MLFPWPLPGAEEDNIVMAFAEFERTVEMLQVNSPALFAIPPPCQKLYLKADFGIVCVTLSVRVRLRACFHVCVHVCAHACLFTYRVYACAAFCVCCVIGCVYIL